MKALVLDSQLRFNRDYPPPEIPSGEALIRVHQAGICSTDIELCKGYMGFHGILGHEFVGVVEQANNRSDLQGQRVVGEINAACNACETCNAGRPTHCPNRTVLGISGRDGAFAEYLRLPLANLFPLPSSVTNDHAVFIEPLAAACEMTQQIHVCPEDRVVVIGDGKLGLLCVQVLNLLGCSVTLLGHHAERNKWIGQHGIHVASQTREVLPGADFIVEATGTSEGFALASALVRPRGTIILKSTYHGELSLDMAKIVIDEISVIGSRCGPFAPALRLLEQRLVEVEPLIHARYSLQNGLSAFEHATSKGILKVMLCMD